jgi:negative regulator of sigma E activity
MEGDVARNIEEQLSAFLDGELPESELQLLVRRLEKDPAYRETLARYSLMGSILRKDPVVQSSTVFRERLMLAVSSSGAVDSAQGDEAIAGSAPRNSGWQNFSAVAAVLVGVAVLGVYQNYPGQEGRRVSAGQLPTEPNAAQSYVRSDTRVASPVLRRQVNPERMTSYLVSHGEFSRSLQGTMVDSRIFVQQARFQE